MRVERYAARVTKVDDPEKRGRIKVVCVGLLGDEDTELPMWVEPTLDWGFFFVPDVGESVEVEVVTGAQSDEAFGQATLDGLDIRWRGPRFWTAAEVETGVARPVPEAFTKERYGKRRGFATPKGHVLVFDDTDGAESITLTWTDGEKQTTVGVEKDGSVKVTTKAGHVLHLKATEELELQLGGGATLKLTGKAGNVVATVGDGAKHVAIVEPLQALWGVVKAVFDGHVHPSAAGPTGPPVTPWTAWDGTINSTKVKIPSG